MATPVQMSPIFNRIPGAGLAPAAALNQIARDQAAAQKAVAAYAASKGGGAKPPTRMAGSPVPSSIFSRARGLAPSLVGPGITAGFGAARIAAGEKPSLVMAETARDAMLSALGGGVGTAVAGPPGGYVGSFAFPLIYSATVGGLKPVDMRQISAADAAQMGGTPSFGGLTTPAFDIPGIPDVTTPVLQGIDFSRTATNAATETGFDQPARDTGSAPASRRPVEERRPPVTREVPASPTPKPQSMNELAQMYAKQRILGAEMAKGGELQRRLYEGGAVEGMSPEALMTWVDANPDLAYRLAEKRGLLPQPV